MQDFRCVLEVSKFSTAADVLKGAEAVCRLWSRASTANELWADFAERDHFTEFCHLGSKKEAYELEVKAYRIVVLKDWQITVYNCKRKKWIRKGLTTEVSRAMDMTLALWGDQVVCCGGFRRNSAYLIGLSGKVTVLPDMLTPRYRHGIVIEQVQLYVFGGINQCGLCCCEALSLHSPRQWEPLPDTRFVHHSFSPFTVKNWVYIWGGGTPRVEVFNLDSQQFTVIGTEAYTQFPGEQCAVVKDDRLYLVTTNCRMTGKTVNFQMSIQHHPNLDKVYSQTCPVLCNGHLFTLWQGVVYRLDFAGGHRIAVH